MKPLTLLIALLTVFASPLLAAPKTPAPEMTTPFSGADQALIDRYLAALGDKFGSAPWALKDGALTARGGKDAVDIREARSEGEIEARIFQTLAATMPKSEAGEARTPVYFAGTTETDLFKGAVRRTGADEAGVAEKAAGNDWKALLDLTSGQISVPALHQAALEFQVDGKAPRRVILRRGEGGTLDAFLEGDGYAYAAGRVLAGGKTERDPVKSGTASAFFEMNAWMQRTLKAADARKAKANPRGLSDGGYSHPEFEKLMGQIRSGLSTENLDKTFDNAGAKAPADLQARAQAAQALIDSGYGGAARWKVNSNGKYADKDGNMTLMVRVKDGPGGKIEETPFVIKKDAHGRYDLASAVGPVTQLLLNGDAVAAKGAAMKAAFTASPAAVAAEVKSDMLVGPGALGFDASRFDGAPKPAVDPALKAALDRRAAALREEIALTADKCPGGVCPEAASVVRPSVLRADNPPVESNAMCVLNIDGAAANKKIVDDAAQPLDQPWVRRASGFKVDADYRYATAVGCITTGNRAFLREADSRAINSLQSLASCGPATNAAAEITHHVEFASKVPGQWSACAEARLKIGPAGG